jgi:hypothetical protein
MNSARFISLATNAVLVSRCCQRFANEIHKPNENKRDQSSSDSSGFTGFFRFRWSLITVWLILLLRSVPEGMRIAPKLAWRLFRQQSLRRDVLGERTIFATASLARENPFPQAFGNSKRPEVKIAKAGRASRAGVTSRSAHLADVQRRFRSPIILRSNAQGDRQTFLWNARTDFSSEEN